MRACVGSRRGRPTGRLEGPVWTAAPVNGRLASPLRPRGDDSYTRRQPEPPEGLVTQALRGSHVEPEEKTEAQTDGRWGLQRAL